MTSRELSAGYILRETLASCHCEPVTDVTGVAIRTNPLMVFHRFLGGKGKPLGLNVHFQQENQQDFRIIDNGACWKGMVCLKQQQMKCWGERHESRLFSLSKGDGMSRLSAWLDILEAFQDILE